MQGLLSGRTLFWFLNDMSGVAVVYSTGFTFPLHLTESRDVVASDIECTDLHFYLLDECSSLISLKHETSFRRILFLVCSVSTLLRT